MSSRGHSRGDHASPSSPPTYRYHSCLLEGSGTRSHQTTSHPTSHVSTTLQFDGVVDDSAKDLAEWGAMWSHPGPDASQTKQPLARPKTTLLRSKLKMQNTTCPPTAQGLLHPNQSPLSTYQIESDAWAEDNGIEHDLAEGAQRLRAMTSARKVAEGTVTSSFPVPSFSATPMTPFSPLHCESVVRRVLATPASPPRPVCSGSVMKAKSPGNGETKTYASLYARKCQLKGGQKSSGPGMRRSIPKETNVWDRLSRRKSDASSTAYLLNSTRIERHSIVAEEHIELTAAAVAAVSLMQSPRDQKKAQRKRQQLREAMLEEGPSDKYFLRSVASWGDSLRMDVPKPLSSVTFYGPKFSRSLARPSTGPNRVRRGSIMETDWVKAAELARRSAKKKGIMKEDDVGGVRVLDDERGRYESGLWGSDSSKLAGCRGEIRDQVEESEGRDGFVDVECKELEESRGEGGGYTKNVCDESEDDYHEETNEAILRMRGNSKAGSIQSSLQEINGDSWSDWTPPVGSQAEILTRQAELLTRQGEEESSLLDDHPLALLTRRDKAPLFNPPATLVSDTIEGSHEQVMGKDHLKLQEEDDPVGEGEDNVISSSERDDVVCEDEDAEEIDKVVKVNSIENNTKDSESLPEADRDMGVQPVRDVNVPTVSVSLKSGLLTSASPLARLSMDNHSTTQQNASASNPCPPSPLLHTTSTSPRPMNYSKALNAFSGRLEVLAGLRRYKQPQYIGNGVGEDLREDSTIVKNEVACDDAGVSGRTALNEEYGPKTRELFYKISNSPGRGRETVPEGASEMIKNNGAVEKEVSGDKEVNGYMTEAGPKGNIGMSGWGEEDEGGPMGTEDEKGDDDDDMTSHRDGISSPLSSIPSSSSSSSSSSPLSSTTITTALTSSGATPSGIDDLVALLNETAFGMLNEI